MSVIIVPIGPRLGVIVAERAIRKPPLASWTLSTTAYMSWMPPKSFGAWSVAVNAPDASVLAVPRTTLILSALRPR